jgi:hypothetical protein
MRKFQFSPLDGAQFENILTSKNQQINKRKKNRYREKHYPAIFKKNKPQHKPTKNQSKVLEFQRQVKRTQKHDTSPSLRCSRKKRMTTKIL